jgi:hypothetical protein
MARTSGVLRVLDGRRWVPLSDFAVAVSRMPKTLVIDFPAGEVRIKP